MALVDHPEFEFIKDSTKLWKKVFFIVLMKIKILSSTSKLEVPTYPITPSPTVVESGKRNE